MTAVSGGGIAIQSFGSASKFSFVCTDDSGNNSYPLLADKDGLTGKFKAGKTGRAEFSDGTYLQFSGGVCVGGNTKEGTF